MARAYAAYIASRAWRTSPARLAELKLSRYRCRLCNAGRGRARITVHHRTYRRLGRERTDDLTALCEECHMAVTDILRRRRYCRAGLSRSAIRNLEPPEHRHLRDSSAERSL